MPIYLMVNGTEMLVRKDTEYKPEGRWRCEGRYEDNSNRQFTTGAVQDLQQLDNDYNCYLAEGYKPVEQTITTDWLTSRGECTPVKKMEDTHLFFTLRLVWNSMMPQELSVGTYKTAYFKPTLYTAAYWKEFLPVMYAELHSRSELPRRYKEQLANMQIEHLLARVSTSEALAQSITDMFERDEDVYVPESRNWDSEKGEQL